MPVPGAPGVWSAQLWFMRSSSYGVRVQVKGLAGAGEAVVPVTAVPMQVLGMQKGMAVTLAALGLFLFAGAVTLVVSSVREGTLPPGEVPDERRRRKARISGALAAVLLAFLLWQGRVWWKQRQRRGAAGDLHAAFHIRTAVTQESGQTRADPRHRRRAHRRLVASDAGSRKADASLPDPRAGPGCLRSSPPRAAG